MKTTTDSFDVCPDCGKLVNMQELLDNRGVSRGLRCNKCSNAFREQLKRSKPVNTTISILLAGAKARAKKYDRPFCLTFANLKDKYTTHCPLLGLRLDWSYGTKAGKTLHASPSLDRFDNLGGYTPDNVWIISYRANTIKRDASFEELRMLARNLARYAQGLPEPIARAKHARSWDLRVKHSPEDVARVIELRTSGCSFRKIEGLTGIPRSTAARIFHHTFT